MDFADKTPEHYSCGVICFFGEKVLIVHQANGHWSFPKGTKEEGESDKQTALRELKEETGITEVKLDPDFKHLERYEAEYPEGVRLKQVTYFLGEAKSTEVSLDEDEVVDYRWLSPKEAMQTLTYKNTRNTLREALKYKNLL